MEENKKKQKKKLSYEELENVATQLSMQLQKAKGQMEQMSGILTRLPYLFKVLEFKDYFDSQFVSNCAKEIQSIISIPEEENKQD